MPLAKRRIALTLLGSLILVGSLVGNSDNREKFGQRYAFLQNLCYEITTRGESAHSRIQYKEAVDAFVSDGEPSAKILVAKLREMRTQELRFLGTGYDASKIFEYQTFRLKKKETNLLKFTVSNILADDCENLSPAARQEVIKAISEAYTPSTFFREDLGAMDHALARIGAPAIPVFLEHADHPDENVRCSASSILNSIAGSMATIQSSAYELRPPPLDCHATVEPRKISLNHWEKWWTNYGKKQPFPKVGSFFEKPSGPGNDVNR